MLFSEGPHERGFGGCLLLFILSLLVFFVDFPPGYLWVPSAIMLALLVLGVGHWIWQVRRSARERNVQNERCPPPDPDAFNFTIYDLFLTAGFTTFFLVIEPYCGRVAVSTVMAAATAVLFFSVNEGEKRLFESLIIFGSFLFIGMSPIIAGYEDTDFIIQKFGMTLIMSIFLSMNFTQWIRNQWRKRSDRATTTDNQHNRQNVQRKNAADSPEPKRKNFHYNKSEQDQTRQENGGSKREQETRRERRESRQEQEHRERRAFSAEELRYCDILGVAPGADFAEIRKAYRQRVAEYHPDKVNHLGEELKEFAERKMKAINEAFAYFEKRYKEKS